MGEDVYRRLFVTTAVAVPISYVVSKKNVNSVLRQGFAVAIWAAYLSIPVLDQSNDEASKQQLPLYSQETMIFSVLVFILPLKLTKTILLLDVSNNETLNVRGFTSYTGSVFYYALPISQARERRPWWQWLQRNLEYMVVICIKLVLLPILDAQARKLAHTEPDGLTRSAACYWALLALFCTSVIAGYWISDLQCVVVNVLSAGRFEMLPMNNYPLFSKSVSEFWSKRYNLLIHELLKETIYIPMRVNQFPKRTAALAAFFVSGILHSWVAYFTFGRGVGRAFLYFVIQVPWMMVEQKMFAKYFNQGIFSTLFRILLTVTFVFLTVSIYAGLFINNYTEWLDINDPNVSKFPILSSLSQRLAESLGFDPQDLRWDKYSK